MLNQSDGAPEVEQAFATGEGTSVRDSSATMDQQFAYRASALSATDRAADRDPPWLTAVRDWFFTRRASRKAVGGVHRDSCCGRAGVISVFAYLRGARGATEGFLAPGGPRRFSRALRFDGPRDELADLAGSLNETAAQLEATIRSLSGERNQSSAILRSMVEGVAVIDCTRAARVLQRRLPRHFESRRRQK